MCGWVPEGRTDAVVGHDDCSSCNKGAACSTDDLYCVILLCQTLLVLHSDLLGVRAIGVFPQVCVPGSRTSLSFPGWPNTDKFL